MEILDQHGNYGTVVRFTNAEWEAFETFCDGLTEVQIDE